MLKESDLLWEDKAQTHYIIKIVGAKTPSGRTKTPFFEVYRNGVCAATRVAIIDGSMGLNYAIASAERLIK